MPDPCEQTRHLRQLELLQGLTDEEIEWLAAAFGTRVYRRGEAISDPETSPERVYLVLEGSVRLFHRGPDGREVTADVIESGRLFGVSALFGPRSDGLLADAATDVAVCAAEAETFLRLVSEHPRIMLKLLTQLGQRLVRVEQQLDRLAATDARTRLAGALLGLAEQDGEVLPSGERRIRSRLTHAEWARQIGASRETVTRLLGGLEDEGYIRREGRRVVLTDPGRLREDFGLAANPS